MDDPAASRFGHGVHQMAAGLEDKGTVPSRHAPGGYPWRAWGCSVRDSTQRADTRAGRGRRNTGETIRRSKSVVLRLLAMAWRRALVCGTRGLPPMAEGLEGRGTAACLRAPAGRAWRSSPRRVHPRRRLRDGSTACPSRLAVLATAVARAARRRARRRPNTWPGAGCARRRRAGPGPRCGACSPRANAGSGWACRRRGPRGRR